MIANNNRQINLYLQYVQRCENYTNITEDGKNIIDIDTQLMTNAEEDIERKKVIKNKYWNTIL